MLAQRATLFRYLPAVHLFFIVVSAIFIVLLFSSGNELIFAYLPLISVVSIAALHSVRVSAFYLAAILAAVTFYFVSHHANPILIIPAYIGIAVFVTIPTWWLARSLRLLGRQTAQLREELASSVANYEGRTKQLQDIAEIGRIATASLEQERLLRTTVELIQSRFSFYYVSILLLSPDGSRLVVEEACGESGRIDDRRGNHLTLGQVSIVGWVAINRQARIALDVGEDPYFFNNPNLPNTHSEVALPLVARGRLLGVLDVHSRETNAFQEEDISALQVMADQVANGLDNARLFEETSSQANLLAELQSVTNLMNQQANTQNALNVLAQKAVSLFDADGGGVFLHQPEQQNLKLAINLDLNDPVVGETLELGQGLSGRAFVENKTLTIDDYATWEGRAEVFVPAGFHAAVAIPLRRQNEPIGVMALTRDQKNYPFKQDEIQVAELLAAQVSAVIINNQLIEETRHLVQRERMINQAAAQIRRSLDAKTILDTTTHELGHLLGDRIVKARLFPQQESVSPESVSQERVPEEEEQL